MKTQIHPISIALFLLAVSVASADVYEAQRERWLQTAQSLIPELIETVQTPVGVVRFEPDTEAYQGIRAVPHSDMDAFSGTRLRQQATGLAVDFGDHYTGDLVFPIESTIPAHAPLQLRIKFAEVPSEMAGSFADYEGTLSAAWLQEEIVTIHTFPTTIKLTNRYAFRYVCFEVLACADDMDFHIRDIRALARSSAGADTHGSAGPLDPTFEAIEAISLKTLKECMQTVFEDGPKRDRRIWVGDLKLQALANAYSFEQHDLVKRGLYLYAGTAREDGLVYGTLFERPHPHPQRHIPIDYSLLFNSVLLDYYEATGDRQTLEDLWTVAKTQIHAMRPFLSPEGAFQPAEDWWYFIDWNADLDKQTALHGTVIYGFKKTLKIAGLLGRESEVAELPEWIARMKRFARDHYFEAVTGVFLSGETHQHSIASQVWMILSGTVSAEEGRGLLERSLSAPGVIKPVSPYLYHYVVEALIQVGMHVEARGLLQSYWGDMVARGADTFWEVYDPEDDFLSPYGSHLINSYCHAWSCTPVYFLRKYHQELFANP